MAQEVTKMGSVGGAGSSATPGGYNQGLQFAAKGNYRGAGGGITQPNLLVSNFGPVSKAAPGGSGYAQGDQFAASAGEERPQAESGGGSIKFSQSDLRGGNSKSGSGYNQGNPFAANKK